LNYDSLFEKASKEEKKKRKYYWGVFLYAYLLGLFDEIAFPRDGSTLDLMFGALGVAIAFLIIPFLVFITMLLLDKDNDSIFMFKVYFILTSFSFILTAIGRLHTVGIL
jgi:hypothetical protein